MTAAACLAWVAEHPGSTQPEIRDALGLTIKGCSNRLHYLRAKLGVLRLDAEGRYWVEPRPRRKKAAVEPVPVTNGELGSVSVTDVVVTLVQLRWPEAIPTERFPAILAWRDQTEQLLA